MNGKMKVKYKFCLVSLWVLCVLLPAPTFASMAGKDFWLAFFKNFDADIEPPELTITITAEKASSGIISIPKKNWQKSFTMPASSTLEVPIPFALAVELYGQADWESNAIYISADRAISVIASNHRIVSTDAGFIFPSHLLRTDYAVISSLQIDSLWDLVAYKRPITVIVATEDNTTIEVNPASTVITQFFTTNQPFTIHLNKGETYKITAYNSITGTTLRSTGKCHPFAVFVGSVCNSIDRGWLCDSCDHLFYQLPPLNFWGKNYFVPGNKRYFALTILASEDSTVVKINGKDTILNAYNSMTLRLQTQELAIQSDKLILLLKQLYSSCYNATDGDPAISIETPLEQFTNRSFFSTLSHAAFNHHYLDVVMKMEHVSQLRLNGTPVGNSFTPFAFAPEYGYRTIKIEKGAYVLTADSGFAGSVYGIGWYDSYLFSTGIIGNGPDREMGLSFTSPLCAGQAVTFKGKGDKMEPAYWELNGDYFEGNTLLKSFPQGPVEIKYFSGISGTHCPFSKDTTVIVNPPAFVEAEMDTTILLGTSVKLKASGNAPIEWSPAAGLSCTQCLEPIAAPQLSIYYVATATNTGGCKARDTVLIHVDKDLHIYVPNIFSPNGDGQNDYLFVRGKGIKNMQFVVYNRWGEKVFETSDPSIGWDGTFRGSPLSPAVFVYTLDAVLESGQRVLKNGDVALVR
jgi:gliding motility-associated-like protein